MCQCFIHRCEAIADADDSLTITECFIEGLTQGECHIFNGVMCVYLEIALRLHRQVEESMDGKMCQHVVEESNSSVDLMLADAVQIQFDRNLCFIRLTGYFGSSHIYSFNAFINASVSSGLPTLIRIWSRRPGLLK